MISFGPPSGDYPTSGGKIVLDDDRELFVHVGWSWFQIDEAHWEPRPVLIKVTLSRYNRRTDHEEMGLHQQMLENTRAAIEALCDLATATIGHGTCDLLSILKDWRGRRIDSPAVCPQVHDDKDPKQAARVSSSLDAIAHYVQQNLPRWREQKIKEGRR